MHKIKLYAEPRSYCRFSSLLSPLSLSPRPQPTCAVAENLPEDPPPPKFPPLPLSPPRPLLLPARRGGHIRPRESLQPSANAIFCAPHLSRILNKFRGNVFACYRRLFELSYAIKMRESGEDGRYACAVCVTQDS